MLNFGVSKPDRGSGGGLVIPSLTVTPTVSETPLDEIEERKILMGQSKEGLSQPCVRRLPVESHV